MSNLISLSAPDFTAPAVLADGTLVEDFNLKNHIENTYAVVFFYPLDFTFVCPSEILAFHHRVPQFKQRDTQIIGISIDSHFVHQAWRNTPVELGGLGAVDFPLIGDIGGEIMQAYGVMHPKKVALRASFLIDRQGIVRHQVLNDLPLGRNVDEMLRMIDALQFYEQQGEVCPAGWQPGEDAIKPSQEGIAYYLAQHAGAL